MEKGIYYIKNTVDEWNSRISGFFPTLDEAKEALKKCNDWYRSAGTGKIYFCEFGLGSKEKLVYEVK